ncbi:MAG: hypothetical protein PHP83_02165 [Clostridia bacterium]|nr:hypothetical protein [Clostridia bacterium]
MKDTVSKFLDGLTKLLAFVTIVAYAAFSVNANWTFITNITVLEYITYIMTYAPLALVALVGVEFAVKRTFIVQLIIYILIAGVVVIQFFPDTFNAIRAMAGI